MLRPIILSVIRLSVGAPLVVEFSDDWDSVTRALATLPFFKTLLFFSDFDDVLSNEIDLD